MCQHRQAVRGGASFITWHDLDEGCTGAVRDAVALDRLGGLPCHDSWDMGVRVAGGGSMWERENGLLRRGRASDAC